MASKIESRTSLLTDSKEISNNIKVFYETLFKQNSSKTKELETKIQNKNSLILYTIKQQIISQTYAKVKYKELIYLTI